jgi:hypothetical protein
MEVHVTAQTAAIEFAFAFVCVCVCVCGGGAGGGGADIPFTAVDVFYSLEKTHAHTHILHH